MKIYYAALLFIAKQNTTFEKYDYITENTKTLQ